VTQNPAASLHKVVHDAQQRQVKIDPLRIIFCSDKNTMGNGGKVCLLWANRSKASILNNITAVLWVTFITH